MNASSEMWFAEQSRACSGLMQLSRLVITVIWAGNRYGFPVEHQVATRPRPAARRVRHQRNDFLSRALPSQKTLQAS
jgi:hypothetical protein